MQEITVAQLRKQTQYFFDVVENGNTIRVCRKGKPIAEIIPFPKSGVKKLRKSANRLMNWH